MPTDDLRERIKTHRWYHTMELAPGVVTPGYVDLRPVVDEMPWPDLRGKRCLDVATFDGFLAFEMERRGASDVVAIDIDDYRQLDFPEPIRESSVQELETALGPERGRGFKMAAEAFGSKVERRAVNVYDLSPSNVGEFDFVVCGSLLVHLRDPIRALTAIRSVCKDRFLSAEGIDAWASLLHRAPMTLSTAYGDQWSVPNRAAHQRMIWAAGFRIEHVTKPYAVPLGSGVKVGFRDVPLKQAIRGILRQGAGVLLTRRLGLPHQAVLARAS